MVRVSMFNDPSGSQGTADGLFYVGMSGGVKGPDTSSFKDQEIPKEWTKVEGVFEVVPDTARMNACAFIWKGTGTCSWTIFASSRSTNPRPSVRATDLGTSAL